MNVANLNVKIGADLSEFDKSMSALTSKIEGIGNKLASAGKTLSAGITLPLIGIATVGTKMAADLDKSLREVNTLFGETGAAAEASFNDISKTVGNLSKEVGIAQSVISQGLYNAVSAGVPKDNIFDFMTVAAQASIAGVTDVNTAVDGLTTVINAFGKDASEVGSVADSMFQAVKGGKTTFAELSASLFNIAPAAASAKVSMQEVNAALATLTAAGVPTSVATTQLRAALVGLQRPSEELDKIFQSLGYQNAQAAIEAKGLGFALDAVKKSTNGNNGALQKLLGSVEAVAAANVLAGTGAGKFASEMKAQQNAAGATKVAFEEMNKSYARMGERAKVALENVGIEIGKVLLPLVGKLAGFVETLASKFAGLSDNAKTAVVILGGIAAALGPALLIIGKIMTLLPTLIVGIKAVGVAFTGITGPIGIAIAAIIAASILIYKNWDKIVAYFSSGAGSAVFEKLGRLVSAIMNAIQKAIQVTVDTGIALWDRFGGSIMAVIDTALAPLVRLVKYVFNQVLNVIDLFTNIFEGNWSGVWKSALKIVQTFSNLVVETIAEMVTGSLTLFGKLASGLGANTIGTALSASAVSVQKFADSLIFKFDEIDSKVKETADVAKDNFPKVSDNIKELVYSASMAANGIDGIAASVERMANVKPIEIKVIPKLGGGIEKAPTIDVKATGLGALLEVQKQLDIAYQKSLAFGSSFDYVGEQSKILEGAITSLLQNGFSANSGAVVALQQQLAGLGTTMQTAIIDIAPAINAALEEISFSLGEMVGNAIASGSGFQEFPKMILGVLGDLAIQVGKIAIKTGVTLLGIQASLKTLNPALAIGAGIALVALGTAVKGSLAKAANGGGGSGGMTASGGGGGGGSFGGGTDFSKGAALGSNAYTLGTQKIEVSGRFDGREIVLVQEHYQRKERRVGG